MLNTTDIHTQIMRSAASNTQSTHGIAAQATAVRLLLLLQARAHDTGEAKKDVQSVLAAYIDQVFACLSDLSQKAMPAVEDLVPSDFKQHPVILLSQAILGLDDETLPTSSVANKSAKQVIFQQLKKIVNNYPGATWTVDDAKWSSNNYFDAETKSSKTFSVSPAQTLNLVCAGMICLSVDRFNSAR